MLLAHGSQWVCPLDTNMGHGVVDNAQISMQVVAFRIGFEHTAFHSESWHSTQYTTIGSTMPGYVI